MIPMGRAVDDIKAILEDYNKLVVEGQSRMKGIGRLRLGLEGRMGEALEHAKKYPLPPQGTRQSPRYQQFVSFCAYWALALGKNVVPLSQRVVGRTLGAQPRIVGKWIKGAVADGLLTLARKHWHDPMHPEKSQAARYRVAGTLLDTAWRGCWAEVLQ